MSSLGGAQVAQLKISEDTRLYPRSNTPSDSSFIFPSSNDLRYPHSFSEPKSTASSNSSIISFTSTLIDGDDEDTRAIRRLLVRKIEARMDGAIDEIDKVMTWLPVVKDIIRDLERRTRSQA